MQVQVEFWQLISGIVGVVVAFASVTWLFGSILVKQFKDSLAARFDAQDEMRKQRERDQDEMRKQREKDLDARFDGLDGTIRQEGEGWRQVERDFLKFQADLPTRVVFRDDYIRGQSVLEAKQDALFNKMELVRVEVAQMKGTKQ